MENKSFLRKNWEEFFLQIVNKRISENSQINKEVLTIRDKNDLNKIINQDEVVDKNIKLAVITIPLNNFDNLVDFFKKIETTFSDETKIIVNYYSILWRPIFFILSKIGLTHYFKNECYF